MRSTMVEGATAASPAPTLVIFCTAVGPLHRASRGPPPPLRCATRGRTSASILAAPLASELCHHQARKQLADLPPATKEGGGAPKGASNQCRAIRRGRAPTDQAGHCAPLVRFAGRARLPALHRGTCMRPWPRSAPGRASWNYRVQTGGPSPAPVQRAPRRPVLVPAETMPRTAREWRVWRHPREPLPLRLSGAPSRKASLDDSMSRIMPCTGFGDACQELVTVAMTSYACFAGCPRLLTRMRERLLSVLIALVTRDDRVYELRRPHHTDLRVRNVFDDAPAGIHADESRARRGVQWSI